jgi:hypothetical protein
MQINAAAQFGRSTPELPVSYQFIIGAAHSTSAENEKSTNI